jgi:hypothetical protein
MNNTRLFALAIAAAAGCTDAVALAPTSSNQQAVTAGDDAEVSASFLQGKGSLRSPDFKPQFGAAAKGGAGLKTSSASAAASTFDSLTHFSGSFTTPGFDDAGNPQSVWPYTMVGRDPHQNRTTEIHAPIIPVTVELLDANGNVGTTRAGKPLRMVTGSDTLASTLNSPVFNRFPTTAGFVQYADGMMRAQFFGAVGDRDGDRDDQGYHTILEPSVKPTRTIRMPFGTYRFAPKADGSCCLFILADANPFSNQLFPATADDTTTVLGAAEHAGDVRPSDITTLLFRDVYLYVGSPANCCILGFHSYDSEPGTASNGNRERRYVMNYSSFISDGLFGGFSDVTAFSHEMAELFADPFVDNATPWWLSIDPFTGAGLCQNNLEVGDVIEVLSVNPTASVPMHNRTYHPQNEALLQWFEFQSPSSAHLGAYSFPDETTLTSLSPPNLLPGCVPAN